MHKSLKIALPLVAFILTCTLLQQHSFAQGVTAKATTRRQGTPKPQLTGSDGSQTGVAKFQGNLTTIAVPGGQALALARNPDCSLSLFTGTYSIGSTIAYSQTGFFDNYERVLHTEAGLTTPVDTFPAGCAQSPTGLGSRQAFYVGQTTKGIQVFAAVGYNPMTGNNALYISSGVISFTFNIFSFSSAGTITSADLNGDGNNDLIIAENGATTTGQVFVMLGNSDGSFQTAVPYAVPGTTSVSALVDDVNGDKKLDLVVSSTTGLFNPSQISILTGNGDGTFNAAQSFAAPTPTYPGSTVAPSTSLTNLITADLRGSGKRDIIASNGLVMLNDGAGNFTAAPSAAFPPLTASTDQGPFLATGDFNGDKKLDLVVTTGGEILTYLGNGDGTFTPGNSYASVDSTGYVSVSDLDGDGNADIFIGPGNNGFFAGEPNIAYALMGNGDGTFQGAPTITGLYTGNNLGDVNGDGLPDLITNNTGQYNQATLVFTVELGTAKGSFNPVSTITLPATITVTTSQFVNPVTLSSANASITSYAVGDLNGDGKADLAFLVNYNGVPVYFTALSNGDGTFAPPVGYGFPQIAPSGGYDISTTLSNLQIGDFNHDGKADLIVSFNDIAGPFGTGLYLQGLVVLPGTGNGTTFNAPIFTYSYNSTTAPGTTNNPPTVNLTADLNGDGNLDLIATNSSFAITNGTGVITVTLQSYTGKGDGTFNAPTTILTSNKIGAVVLADFNHDGKLDIAALGEVALTSQGQFFTALGKGDGTFATPTVANFSGGDLVPESGLAAGDFDGDGNIDLVYLDANDFSGIYYGKGDGTFVSVPFNGNPIPKDLINLGFGSPAIAVDLNKDGKLDVLAGSGILINTYATAPTVVPQFNSTTTISASATTFAAGSSVTFTATVLPAAGSTGSPTGFVVFGDGETLLGSATLDGTGKATFSTTALAAGTHNITAGFAGSTTFLGSLSSPVVLTVTPGVAGIATTTTLTSSASTAIAGTSITFTAVVTPASGTAVPTGTVTFTDGATTLGTGTLDGTGKATLTTSALAIGAHSITAAYGGATTPTAFSNSASTAVPVTITAAPIISTTTALSANVVGGTAVAGTSITFTAAVTPASGTAVPTGTVTFKDGATTLGTGTLDGTGKATLTTSTLAVGAHTITAAYSGAATFSTSTSSAFALTITAAPASDFSITLSPATATVARSTTNTSTITVTSIGGFSQSVQLVATGNPTYTTLTTGAASLTPTATTPATTTLTLVTDTVTLSQARRVHLIEFAATLPLGLLGTAFFGLRRRRWSLQLLLVASATLLLAATGCGGGGSKSTSTTNTPTPGTYTITVQGTAGTLTHSATYTVTIQ